MTVYSLTNKTDFFVADDVFGFENGSSVIAGNGDDVVIAQSTNRLWSNLVLDGGNGNDALSAEGVHNTFLGGNGDDHLFASGFLNTLDGGNGNDVLESFTRGLGIAGNTLTGGRGNDTFIIDSLTSPQTSNDTDGVVSQGDIFRGTFNTITDYEVGELLKLGATTQVAEVSLQPGDRPGELLPDLNDGQYVVKHGTILSDTSFQVDNAGQDLLVIYDKADGVDPGNGLGVVMLRDFQDIDGLNII